jgi:uncharacterized protein YidB (DUF937 family)
MNLFESIKEHAGGLIGGEAHAALTGALAASPLGDVSGLLDKLHDGGLDEAVDAWTTGGEHAPVTPDQLREALGDEHVEQLAAALGVSGDELLKGLAEHLPALAAHEEADASDEDERSAAAVRNPS